MPISKKLRGSRKAMIKQTDRVSLHQISLLIFSFLPYHIYRKSKLCVKKE